MRVSVDQDQFVKLQDLCGRLELCKPSQPFNEMSTAAEEHVFKEILQSSYTELETIIEEVLHQKLRSSRKSVPDRKGRASASQASCGAWVNSFALSSFGASEDSAQEIDSNTDTL